MSNANCSEAVTTQIANLQRSNAELLAALESALRYIEVSVAYKGAMTAAQVEAAILENKNIAVTGIGANSCNTLALFDLAKARAAIAKAKS